MNKLIIIHDVAEIEINEAANFYDLKCQKICTDLKEELVGTLELFDPKPPALFRIAIGELESWLIDVCPVCSGQLR